ncbi:MAG: GIY-YIG nuclease family protein [Kosmotogaceae bacterium]
MNMNTGSYLLFIKVSRRIEVSSKKSDWTIEPGLYIYVGSAMSTLTGRIKRHLTEKKKKHWHIDFLTSRSEIFLILLLPSETKVEKDISQFVSKFGIPIKGFGSTDYKDLNSNLYKINEENAEEIFKKLFSKWRELL